MVTRTYVPDPCYPAHRASLTRKRLPGKIYVDEGPVCKGQLDVSNHAAVFKAEVQKAEAEARFAEIQYLNPNSLPTKQRGFSQMSLRWHKQNLTKQKRSGF